MPSKIYLRADESAIYSSDPPDVVVQRIEAAGDARFIQVLLTPYGRHDAPRTAYVNPADVTAVLPLDPKELEAQLDDPPDWY